MSDCNHEHEVLVECPLCRIKQLEDVLKKISIQKCSCLDCKSKVFMAQKALEEK